MADKFDALKNMNTRQKVTAGIMVVVVIIIFWQIMGMFGGGSGKPKRPTTQMASTTPSSTANLPPEAQSKPKIIKEVPEQVALTAEDLAMQQAMLAAQARYMQQLNDLQSLRMVRSIADMNKEIMASKLATVTSEKKIVDLLQAAAPPTTGAGYAPSLINPTPSASASTPPTQVESPKPIGYTAVSVTEIQGVWNAVLGYQGTLYSVRVGDILPVDGSTVVDINSRGVTLDLKGEKRVVSLVSII